MKDSSWNISVLALLLAAATVVVVVRAQQPAADFLLTNGKIITVDDRFIIPQAVELDLENYPHLPAAVWAADPPDPTLGTWKLNVAKSKFIPGPPFRSETRTYVALPGGVQVTIHTVDGDGKTITTEFPVNYDGKYHHITTSGGPADAIALTRIDALTSEAHLKHGAQVVATARRVISKDGKTMSITYNGATSPDGSHTDFVLVYDKQ